MCGRFTQAASWDGAAELFELDGELPELPPRFNVAPTQNAAVVRSEPGPGARRRLRLLRWGLVPAGASGPSVGSRLINARSETVARRPSFRAAYAERRCLVPVDGFYEWARGRGARRRGGRSQPWRFRLRDGGFFALAGLWERWIRPRRISGGGAGDLLETFTILTTAANSLVAEVHDRMPVIVTPGDYGSWLGGGEIAFAPFPAEFMRAHPVRFVVNDPRNDDPRCIEPVAPPEEPRAPPSLFARSPLSRTRPGQIRRGPQSR